MIEISIERVESGGYKDDELWQAVARGPRRSSYDSASRDAARWSELEDANERLEAEVAFLRERLVDAGWTLTP